MDFFKNLTYTHQIFLYAVLLGIIGLLIAYATMKKDLADVVEAKGEFEALVHKSNTIQTTTDTSVKHLVEIINEQQTILQKVDSQLEKTEIVLKSQGKIIDQQAETIKNLTGSDQLPHLHVRLSDIHSSAVYKIDFTLVNPDNKFPINGINVSIKNTTHIFKQSRFRKQEEWAYIERERMIGYKEVSTFSLMPNLVREFHSDQVSRREEFTFFEIVVRWNKGYYAAEAIVILRQPSPVVILQSKYGDLSGLERVELDKILKASYNVKGCSQIE